MTLIYFAASQNWPDYETLLPVALAKAGIAAKITTHAPSNPAAVDFIIYAPSAPLRDFTPFVNCRAVGHVAPTIAAHADIALFGMANKAFQHAQP